MRDLLKQLQNPERQFKIFHVAGTNGKGSTCAYLESILKESGYRCGLYTSPHLQSMRERIRVNGEMINEELFCKAEQKVYEAALKLSEQPSFFERITAMALLIFAEQRVEVAVLEVGLGGRLDATNVVSPWVCGITRIDEDHKEILGDTIEKIAAEKAGIMKPHVPVVVGMQEEKVQAVLRQKAQEVGATYIPVEAIDLWRKKSPLFGEHQLHNLAVAVRMLEVSGLARDAEKVMTGILSTKWPGRYESLNTYPYTVFDGAHNPAGMRALLHALSRDPKRSEGVVWIAGFTEGHDVNQMIRLVKKSSFILDTAIATCANTPRSMKAIDVQKRFMEEDIQAVAIENLPQAVSIAMERAKETNATLLVAGSLHLVGAVRGIFIPMPHDEENPLY